jgi:hypothetical protein
MPTFLTNSLNLGSSRTKSQFLFTFSSSNSLSSSGDLPVKFGILRQKHLAHSACAQMFEHTVMKDHLWLYGW